jgi:hypothetical protein
MSLEVSPALLERAARGSLDEFDFAAAVRRSLPYAWETVAALAEQVHEGRVDFAEHRVPPPGETEFGQLLRAMASDAIRACLERHFQVRIAFQNCHRVGAFRPETTTGPAYTEFVSARAQLLNQSPALRSC